MCYSPPMDESHRRILSDSVQGMSSLITAQGLPEIRRRRMEMVRSMLESGESAHHVSRLLSRFNQAVIRAVIAAYAEEYPWLADCVVLEFGSGGRDEQVLSSDQDNGLLYLTPPDEDDMDEAGGEIVATLDHAGIPLCDGGVMLSNREWRGDFEDWKARLKGWLSNPTEKGPWQSGLILDFRPVWGDGPEVRDLRRLVHDYVRKKPLVLKFLVQDLAQYHVPLTFFGAFITEKSGPFQGMLNLKKAVLAHLTNGVRILSLKYKLPQTNTMERLSALVEAGHITSGHGGRLMDGWEWAQTRRHLIGLACLEKGEEPHNFINPNTLAKEEKKELKTAIQAVEKLIRLIEAGSRMG